jgi:pyruvate formate-lyase activating enzyme-like uncharacterized protein
MTWTQADDDRIRELCKTQDVGAMKACPKCGLGSGGQGEAVLAVGFCQHKYCPVREWRDARAVLAKANPDG